MWTVAVQSIREHSTTWLVSSQACVFHSEGIPGSGSWEERMFNPWLNILFQWLCDDRWGSWLLLFPLNSTSWWKLQNTFFFLRAVVGHGRLMSNLVESQGNTSLSAGCVCGEKKASLQAVQNRRVTGILTCLSGPSGSCRTQQCPQVCK